jgi:hypothetical protein
VIREAWIESPLQFINAVEYSVATSSDVAITVRAGVPGLDEAAGVLGPQLPRRVAVRGSRRSVAGSPFARARTRLIGDAYSGQFRAIVAATGTRDLVIVDDGTSSLAMASQLERGAGLVRMGQRENPVMRLLGAATTRRLRRSMADGDVEVFSAYAADDRLDRLVELGARVRGNEYAWLRSLRLPSETRLSADSVVLGTALVDDGLIDMERYCRWLRRLVRESGPIEYLPHRRETDASLARYRTISGLEVRPSGLPAEIAVRARSDLRRVVTLPSSAVATLSAVMPEGVELVVSPIPDSWWTPVADDRVRAVLGGERPWGGADD